MSRDIAKLNAVELERGLTMTASWHDEFKDSSWVFVGGLAFELTEGDILTVFSQWGEIVDMELVRDKATGKSRGFAYVCYEDQRSTVLCVDNFNGSTLLERTLKVDHHRYKHKKDEKETDAFHRVNAIVEANREHARKLETQYVEVPYTKEELEDPMHEYISSTKSKRKSSHKHKSGHKHKSHKDKKRREDD